MYHELATIFDRICDISNIFTAPDVFVDCKHRFARHYLRHAAIRIFPSVIAARWRDVATTAARAAASRASALVP